MNNERKVLGAEGRRLLVNALEYFQREKNNGAPVQNVLAVQKRAAECFKISERTVRRVVNMSKTGDISRDYSKNYKCSRSTDVPDAVKTEVRNTIYEMYQKKKHITLDTLLKQVVEEKQIWEFKRVSLWKLVKSLGFRFKESQHRIGLCEQSHVVSLRQAFLMEYVRNLDAESPWDILFQDETWIFSKGNFFCS